MKRLFCLVLAVLMVLSIAACGKSGSKAGLQVGYGRAVITPANGTPLAGYGATDTRLSANVLDDLYATCISFFDGEDQVLLITTDVICTYEKFFIEGRKAVSKATGVAESNIFISATHTHAAPDLNYTFDEETNSFVGENADAMAAYMTVWTEGLAAASKDALEDQCAATMSATKFQTEYLNFVRHYEQSTGGYTGDNFGDMNISTITGYAEEGDKEMVLVKFSREGKKDILLMNFQAHPAMNGGATRTDVSADFVGSVRTLIEAQEDVLFAYYTGAAGNQNVKTYLAEDNAIAGQYADIMPYSKELVRQATEAMTAGMTPISGYDVKVVTTVYEGKINHQGEAEHLEIATELYTEYSKTGNRDLYNKKAQEAGFTSIYACGGMMRRAAMGESLDMEMNALSIGDLAMITAPYEMFSTQSNFIKANSPYDFTVVITCSGVHRSYIPSQKGYEIGCYEATGAYFEPGTGELAANEFVALLNQLKGN